MAPGRKQSARPPALLSLSGDDGPSDGGAAAGAEVFSMSTPAGCGAQEHFIGTPQGRCSSAVSGRGSPPEVALESSPGFATESGDVPWRERLRPQSAVGREMVAAEDGCGTQRSSDRCSRPVYLEEETAELLLEVQLEAAALSVAEPFATGSPSARLSGECVDGEREPAHQKDTFLPIKDWSPPRGPADSACLSSTCSPSTCGSVEAWPSPWRDEFSGKADDLPVGHSLHEGTCPNPNNQSQIVDLDLDVDIEL
mmetsp:Transcript_116243/g.292295  ORF Transcript_116243/g.292295 Transcript_116243/m.292295 type:complete len:254 (+) Transcript_116243:59-820(+)